MTPRELSRERHAAITRRRQELERDVFIAWQTAAFVPEALVGKLTDFRSVMARIQSSGTGRQSYEEMKAQLQFLSLKTGFPIQQEGRG